MKQLHYPGAHRQASRPRSRELLWHVASVSLLASLTITIYTTSSKRSQQSHASRFPGRRLASRRRHTVDSSTSWLDKCDAGFSSP